MAAMTKTVLAVFVLTAAVSAFAPELSAAVAATARYVIDSYVLMYVDAEGLRFACL